MRIEVYHQTEPTFREGVFGPAAKAATRETALPLPDALEEAFRLTNLWDEAANPGLAVEPGKHRSTSVGDVAVAIDGALRSAWQGARAGWTPIDPAREPPALPSGPAASAAGP